MLHFDILITFKDRNNDKKSQRQSWNILRHN